MRGEIDRRAVLTAFGIGLAGAGFTRAARAAGLPQGTPAGVPASIRVAVANEVPYGYMDANGHATGIGPEVATHVLGAMGLRHITWVVTPFGSLIPGLEARRFDMVAAEQNILPVRCGVVAFSAPDSSYAEGLLVKRGNPENIHSYEDIKKDPKLKLAIVSGADELGFAQAAGIPQSQIVTIDANADSLSVIETGRANAYAATELTVAALAARSHAIEAASPFTDPVVNGRPVRSYGGFSFRKSDTALLTAFDQGLTAFKKTGAWTKIMTGVGLNAGDLAAARGMKTKALCAGKA